MNLKIVIKNTVFALLAVMVVATYVSGEIGQVFAMNTQSVSTFTAVQPYYIKVNVQEQVVTIYSKDGNGEYTVPVKAMLCSTGAATPSSGVYGTSSKYRWHTLFYGVYGQYTTRIVGSILFHSVPYLTYGDAGSLLTEEYDQLGLAVSAGCIRLTVADAKWIYDYCATGTLVEFYSSSIASPLTTPVTRKISDMEGELKNWDPTDLDANNPWLVHLGIQSEVVTVNKIKSIEELFDAEYYARMNTDVAAIYGTDYNKLYKHFIQYGMKEGRSGTPNFNVLAYKSAYPDLEAIFQDNIEAYYNHYETSGQKEGRTLTTLATCKAEGIIVIDFHGNSID
ncbi:MAG: L,D-transpeptidase [Eubacteriales bacterium]